MRLVTYWPFAPGHRAVVDAELHRQRRLVDLERGQRIGVVGVAQALAEADAAHPGDHHDRARPGGVDLDAVEALEAEEARHLRLLDRAVAVAHRHPLLVVDRAVDNAPDGDRPEVLVGLDVGHEHLQRGVDFAGRLGHAGEDGLEERAQVGHLAAELGRCLPVARDGEEDGEVDLLLGGVEVDEEVVDLVQHFLRAGVGAVDLVDADDRGQAEREGLLEHEARLRKRTLGGIDEEHHAVDHAERALDLTAEVGVARRVDDVDRDLRSVVGGVGHGGVLRHDGDALLTLEVHRVHDALGDVLVVAEGAGLPEKRIDEGRLAVVDVGDDGDVADRTGHGEKRATCAGKRRRRGKSEKLVSAQNHAHRPAAGPARQCVCGESGRKAAAQDRT